MSVHRNRVAGWDVRWRDPDGKQRSKSFNKKREADKFDGVLKQIREAARTKAAIEQARKAAGL